MKWISVEERLPEVGDRVSVKNTGGELGGAWLVNPIGSAWSFDDGWMFTGVTHWRANMSMEPSRAEWISVEEKLPEVATCVSVLRRKGANLESFDAYLVNTDNWWTTKGAAGYVFTDVTHWAPLPEPPQEPEASNGLRCPHCKKALRLEPYASYYSPLGTQVCPYCDKPMEISLRLVTADG